MVSDCLDTQQFSMFISMFQHLVEVMDEVTIKFNATVGPVIWQWDVDQYLWCIQ